MASRWLARSGMLRTVMERGQGFSKEPPAVRFVLFGAERCGSALLLDLLKRADQIHCDRNLLDKSCFFPLRYIQRQALQADAPIYGFKLSSQDLLHTQRISEPDRFMTLLHEQGYRIIHLHRQDIMRHAIALLKAQAEADLPERTARRLKRQPIQVQPEALLKTLKALDNQRLEEAAILANVPCLRLTYEADLLDSNSHNATAQRLCQFLDLDYQPGSQPQIRLVHQQLTDLIANYEEVCAALKASEYAYVLARTAVKLAI